jgi:hypothetical protein
LKCSFECLNSVFCEFFLRTIRLFVRCFAIFFEFFFIVKIVYKILTQYFTFTKLDHFRQFL